MKENKMNQYEDVVKFLTEYRKHNNILQSDLAKRAKITQAQISKYENFKQTASPEVMFAWINALDLELHILNKNKGR